MKITYKEPFKIVVYGDGLAIGSIKKRSTGRAFRYAPHGGGAKGPWLESVDAVKASLEAE